MKRDPILCLLVLLAGLLLGVVGCSEATSSAAKEAWTCPMHPTYVADRPGTCPICNMDLVPKEAPGERAPEAPGAQIDVDPAGLDRAGVVTAVARRGRIERTVRAAGAVVADERREVRAQSKIAGWIERLDVNATGLYVEKGAPAMAIYSPALQSAQSDYLLAREAANRFASSSLAEVRRGGQELLVGARRRLELLDVPERFIVELDRTRTLQRTVDLLVPASGFVTAKSVVLGQEIQPGMELYTVTDLSSVWVEAAFYESEARWVALGKPATIRLPFDPGRTVEARIRYVYPTLDRTSRTLTARFELPNPGFALRPGMFVDVELHAELGEGVLVPASAVLDSGLRKTIFVAVAEGRFEAREVELGERSEDEVLVARGVEAGERVATRASFLLDAESRISGTVPLPVAGAPVGLPGHAAHEPEGRPR